MVSSSTSQQSITGYTVAASYRTYPTMFARLTAVQIAPFIYVCWSTHHRLSLYSTLSLLSFLASNGQGQERLLCKPLALTCLLFHSVTHLTIVVASPQLCYYAANKLASDDIIPCYTSTNPDTYSCCKIGDTCLRRGACYNGNTGVTYQYGCTDSSYLDERCPPKCGLGTEVSHWTGLVYCNGTNNGMPNNTWLCHHPENCGGKGDCATKTWDEGVARIVPEDPVGVRT